MSNKSNGLPDGILYKLKTVPHKSYGRDFDTISINDGEVVIITGDKTRRYNLAEMSELVIFPRNM